MDELAKKYVRVLEYLDMISTQTNAGSIIQFVPGTTYDDLRFLLQNGYVHVWAETGYSLEIAGKNYLAIYRSSQNEKVENKRIQEENKEQQRKTFIWTVTGTIIMFLTLIISIILLIKS